MSIVGVIPAAGYATRLQPLAGSKEVLPVRGKPMLDHVVGRMLGGGCDRLRVVTRVERSRPAADNELVTRDRDIAAIVLFLVCVGAFAYAGWSGPASAPFTGPDVPVYRESYRECTQRWQERPFGSEPHPTAMAAEWGDTYGRDRRAAARTGCLDAITGQPPKV